MEEDQHHEEHPPQPATIFQQIIHLKNAKSVLCGRPKSSYLKLNVFEEAVNECILATVLKQHGISFQRCFHAPDKYAEQNRATKRRAFRI